MGKGKEMCVTSDAHFQMCHSPPEPIGMALVYTTHAATMYCLLCDGDSDVKTVTQQNTLTDTKTVLQVRHLNRTNKHKEVFFEIINIIVIHVFLMKNIFVNVPQ